ncbi:MAG: hypothetical protein SOT34_02900, partial [Candidatus Borkfalkiaceae bacterium]|nr:hypothetical protein [Christensenellaceae bacterium]
MKKSIILFICFFLLSVFTFSFSSCKKKNEHTHDFSVQKITDEYLSAPATCTEKARYFYSCSCGEKGTEIFEAG